MVMANGDMVAARKLGGDRRRSRQKNRGISGARRATRNGGEKCGKIKRRTPSRGMRRRRGGITTGGRRA